MTGMRCNNIFSVLTDAAKPFGWDAFVYTFSIAADWTDPRTHYVQEASSTMREFLRAYEKLGLGHNLHRFSLVRSDLPRTFEVAKFGMTAADARLAALMREWGWQHGLAAPCYGYGGALGLTVLVSRENKPLATRVRETLAFLTPRQGQLNAWAREVLERTSRTEALSPREVECLMLVGEGRTSKDIAAILSIKKRTVEFHIQNGMQKLGVVSRSQAASRLAQLALPQVPVTGDPEQARDGSTTTVRAF